MTSGLLWMFGHLVLWTIALSPAVAVFIALRVCPRVEKPILWMGMAYLVSLPGEVGRMLGYQWGAEWVASNVYPVLQLSLFVLALAGAHWAMLVALLLAVIATSVALTGGITEPSVLVRVVGGLVAGGFAIRGNEQLRGPVIVYCVLGATVWVLMLPYMEVYGWQNTVGYVGYHLTQFVSYGLFVHAALTWKGAET
jgi:hypothetical protein